MGARDEDIEQVVAVAEPGDSAAAIAEKLAGRRSSNGREWHRVKVHRVAAELGRRCGRPPTRDVREARRRRAGDTVELYRRRCR